MSVTGAPADTEAQALLWAALAEQLPHAGFHRNAELGLFAVDFLSPTARLIVEIDGARPPAANDRQSAFAHSLELAGHRVLHFWDDEVRDDIGGVLHEIARNLPRAAEG